MGAPLNTLDDCLLETQDTPAEETVEIVSPNQTPEPTE